jgi:hypothetical protein
MSPDTTVIRELIEGAAEVDWPDPLPFVPAGERQHACPLDALPTVIREAVCAYQAYWQQPVSLVGCSALADASLATQGLADVARDTDLTGPISLNFIVVALLFLSGRKPSGKEGWP